MIRIVLGEDQNMLRGALATLLQLEDDLEVVGQAGDGKETLALIERLNPDVCVVDIEMPLQTGLDVAEVLKTQKSSCKVLILTTFARPGYFQRAMAAGVYGYLVKDSPSEQLADAIRRVYQGKRVISPELSLAVWEDPNVLTPREREVLQHVAQGLTLQEIGQKLFLSHGTVRNYMSEIIGKLQAGNRVEAVTIARSKGWID